MLSFAPAREESTDEATNFTCHADPIREVWRSLLIERIASVKDCFDLAALIVYHCVESLLRGSSESSLKVFRVFEGYTSDKIEAQTIAYKKFRQEVSNKLNEQNIFQTTEDNGDTRTKDEQETDIGKDLNNLLELNDITDELKILAKLLKEQTQQVDDLIKKYEMINKEPYRRGILGLEILNKAKGRIKAYEMQVAELNQSATESAEKYENLIDLKESHSGVQEARVASEQARVVNIFTIITIIFSPLSFFAGIFGMVGPLLRDPPKQ